METKTIEPNTPEEEKMIYETIVKRATQIKDEPIMDIVINLAALELTLANLLTNLDTVDKKSFIQDVNQTLRNRVRGAEALLAEDDPSLNKTE